MRDRQTLDFTAVKTCKERLNDNTFELGSQRLLKSIALYGANASGKSNMMTAFNFLKLFIINSAKDTQSSEDIPVLPFLLCDTTMGAPSCFEIEFAVGKAQYRYGIEMTHSAVVQEWLFRNETEKTKETSLFRRALYNNEDTIEVSSAFEEAKGIEDRTRANALFLSTCALLAVKEAEAIIQYFTKSINVLSGETISNGYSSQRFMDGSLRSDILDLLKAADTSIQDLTLTEGTSDSEGSEIGKSSRSNKRLDILTHHRVYTKAGDACGELKLPFSLESLGTRKLFALAGPIIDTLQNGRILFIDEMDSRIHPILTRNIVKLFNSAKANQTGAQLFFNTHDTNLLSYKVYNPSTEKEELLFRRDQIYFSEKDKTEATHVYSLIEFKDESGRTVRNDASFEKDYFGGHYGAIPYIGLFPFAEEKT